MEYYLNHNDNETDEHFGLKLAAWKWLEDKCQIIGTEVSDDGGGRVDVAGIKIKWGKDRIHWEDEWKRPDGYENKTFQRSKEIITSDIEQATIRRVEAKASRGDFARQFGNFTEGPPDPTPRGPEIEVEEQEVCEQEETGVKGYSYIVTPSGMFKREEIPSGYGWLEVDLSKGLYATCSKNPRSGVMVTPYGKDQKVLSWVRRIAWSASSRMSRMFRIK